MKKVPRRQANGTDIESRGNYNTGQLEKEKKMDINIQINGIEDLTKALATFAKAIEGHQPPAQPVQQPELPTQPAQLVQPPELPTQPPVQPLLQQPTQQLVQPQVQPVQQPVATSTTAYTLDDLAKAAMTLMDKGMQPQLLQLLSQYGVDALPSLPEGQYGTFATALRGLGAQI